MSHVLEQVPAYSMLRFRIYIYSTLSNRGCVTNYYCFSAIGRWWQFVSFCNHKTESCVNIIDANTHNILIVLIFLSSTGTGSGALHSSQSYFGITSTDSNTVGTVFRINREDRLHHVWGKFFFDYIPSMYLHIFPIEVLLRVSFDKCGISANFHYCATCANEMKCFLEFGGKYFFWLMPMYAMALLHAGVVYVFVLQEL